MRYNYFVFSQLYGVYEIGDYPHLEETENVRIATYFTKKFMRVIIEK